MLLTRLPIPPTSNRFLMPAQGRLIKTPEARRYEQAIKLYELRFFKEIEAIKKAFAGKQIQIERFFIFERSRLISKKDTIKRLDTSNRIKILDDAISKIIDIDDCMFIKGPCEKLWCETSKDEQVIVRFSEYNLRPFKGIEAL